MREYESRFNELKKTTKNITPISHDLFDQNGKRDAKADTGKSDTDCACSQYPATDQFILLSCSEKGRLRIGSDNP